MNRKPEQNAEILGIRTMMISLFVLFSQIDPSLAADTTHRNTDGEPYGIFPPVYPFDPHPLSTPDHIIHSNRPIICNNNTQFNCICMQPYSSPHSKPPPPIMDSTGINPIPDCSIFIKTDDLPVVDMRMRQVNTESLLHSGVSYEEYFKKRISSIVSHYCQHNTHECPGTTLRMSHVSQENVVILRMDHLRGNVTRLLFVLTKNDRNEGIVTENMIIDPIKVKYILASQVGPLSRVLGGIKIDSVRAAKLKRNSGSSYATPEQRVENMRDNSKLVKGLIIVCAFFLLTYLIACIQCLRYFHRKRQSAREAKQAESGLAAAVECKNYGTCENSRKPSRNGHVHVEERIPLTYEQIDENANEEPQPLTERQTRNWFMCDSSQLPREPTFDIPMETHRASIPRSIPNPDTAAEELDLKKESPILTKREAKPPVEAVNSNSSEETMFPPSKDFSDYVDDQFHKSRASLNSPDVELPKTPQEDAWDEYPVNKNIPPVVLLQSETPEIPHVNHIMSDSPNAPEPKTSLMKSDSPTFARPRSRRGSRIDEEEGTLDIPELKALHYDDPLAEPLDAPIPPENIKTEIDQEDRWSSSEEGEVDVYFKMSDDEDVTREELDWKKALAKAELEKESELQGNPLPGSSSLQRNPSIPKKTETPPSSPIQTHTNMDTDSEDEDDDDFIMSKENRKANDLKEEEAFVYERLREELSPQPPIVVDLDTTDLDLDPIKAMPPPPPGMFPDSPPESGIGGIYTMERSQEMSNSSDDDEDSIR